MTFEELRKANLERCAKSFHGLDRWTVAEWAVAVAGECGELCNVIKKMRRLITNPDWNVNDFELDLLGMASDELADLVIYADLLAAKLGLNLADCIKEKFNRVSDKVGSDVKL